ncbi:sensor histidine kinase, partial [Pontibacter harenae]|uniref:sensor histidine kinase n=1 Tax=Pontibacter harenae TaxID=2894083 RepID=UPI001E3CA997
GEVVSFAASSFLPPDMVYVCETSLREALQGNRLRFDLELITAGKERRVFDATKYPIIVNGEVISVQTVAKDITPMVRSYETARRQAEKLNTVFESITDAFFTIDRGWNVTYINREAERLAGFDKRRHIGENLWDVFPEQVGGEFYNQYLRAFETGKAVHFTAFLKEVGNWLQVKAFPSAAGMSIYFDDMTEQVRTRQELEKLSLVASKTNSSVLIADKDWRIEWVNEGFTRLMGYSLQEAIGKRPSELLHNQKTDTDAINSQQEKLFCGEGISFEVLNEKKNGEEVWVNVEINPICDDNGELVRFIEVQTDITALKNSKIELSKLTEDLYRKNSDLQQFTYIVSHNLRAPVSNALGLARMLPRLEKGTKLYDNCLTNFERSILNLDTVLKDMNTILSIRDGKETLEQEPLQVRLVLEQVLESLQETIKGCGGKVIMDIDEGLSVRGNKAYLYSVFLNLLSNAIKYRSEERPLQVEIKGRGNTEGHVTVSFSDNGTGFDMKLAKDNIFKLYKRFHTSREGRGIGLYLTKTHLEAMGGRIEVNSEAGTGTCFKFYMPAHKFYLPKQ